MKVQVKDVQELQKFWGAEYKKMALRLAKKLGYEAVYIGAGGLYGIKDGVIVLLEQDDV